jgi:toxin HigB-1
VIRSFGDKRTQEIFQGQRVRKYQQIAQVALRRLVQIDSAEELRDLASPPANRLELLKGNRVGQYSVRINDQYRICFRWRNGHAYEVEIADYH